jgi:hypothetical protein
LLGILKQIKVGKLGSVNEVLKDLNNKVNKFLEEYDDDGNEEIDIDELTNEREKFTKELSKVEEIIRSIKHLEEEVINHHQGSTDEKETKKEKKIKSIIAELSDELTGKQESKEFGEKAQAELPQRKIIKIIPLVSLGQKDKRQVLVISRNKKSFFSFLDSDKKCYSLDMIEYKKSDKDDEKMKVKDNKDFPKWFNSEKTAQERAQEIELERKANRVLKELKKIEAKEETNNEIKKEELISIIKRQLEEEEKETVVNPLDNNQELEETHEVVEINNGI